MIRQRLGRLGLFAAMLAAQFVLFETAMRLTSGSEAGLEFQALFTPDPDIGYRLKPGASARFRTAEFDTRIQINSAGLRDDEIGPKPPGERRILVLGDSLVLSVQVPPEQTFCEELERRLNQDAAHVRYRVINAGVQGYGPVEQLLLFRKIVEQIEPDLVIATIFVGNDASEALAQAYRLDPNSRTPMESSGTRFYNWLRRTVRRSMVLQTLRLRVVSVRDRFQPIAPPEPPLPVYWPEPPPEILRGVEITKQCVREIARLAASHGARTAVLFLPARFQVDDRDYGQLREIVAGAGGTLVRDGASVLFRRAFSDVLLPQLDGLTALRAALPGPDVFFQRTVHFTPRGHEVLAQALARFLESEQLVEGDGRLTARNGGQVP
jgi:lysophospholipase L1-like esterase